MNSRSAVQSLVFLAAGLLLAACNLPSDPALDTSLTAAPPAVESPMEPEAAEAESTAPEYAMLNYGASPTSMRYGGCEPTAVTFEIITEGSERVESAAVEVIWARGSSLAGRSQHALADEGPSQDAPSAHRFAAAVDVASDAAEHLAGEPGSLGWSISVELTDGSSLQYPQGDPNLIQFEPCPEEVATTPTEPSIANPQPTPTATTPVVRGPLVHSHGQQTLREGETFDLDEGEVGPGGLFPAGDFRLDEGDDPYLDDIAPFENAYFGWHGAEQPSIGDCGNTLKANFPQTILWPEQETTYYCYETNEGRAGWMRIDVWVSLPLNERRLEFGWFTWE